MGLPPSVVSGTLSGEAFDEFAVHATAPLVVDTDGDGFSDATEILLGTDPLDPLSKPGAPVPALPPWSSALLLTAIAALAAHGLRVR